jgi:Uma2 family endonuclease
MTMAVVAPLSSLNPETLLPKMTFEEFLEWLDEDTRAEWVDGDVEIATPSGYWHQEIVGFLFILLRYWASLHGGVVLNAPYLMLLAPGQAGETRRGREPDLLYVAIDNPHRITEYYVDGPADMVVEVISPESRRVDRNAKFFEYEKAGVREYWLIDLDHNQAEFYRLNETGQYARIELTEGRYESAVLNGFTLEIAMLWQRPLPDPFAIIKAGETAANATGTAEIESI